MVSQAHYMAMSESILTLWWWKSEWDEIPVLMHMVKW